MLTNLARWVTSHARLVLQVTLIATIVAGVFGFTVFSHLRSGGFADPRSDSDRAAMLVSRDFGGSPDLVFLVQARRGSIDDAAARSAGESLTRQLSDDPSLRAVASWFTTPAPSLRSRDGRAALIVAQLPGSRDEKDKQAGAVVARYQHLDSGALTVKIGGPSGMNLNAQTSKDIALAESIAIPLTLILLIVIFGSVVAALLPLAVALVSILGSFAILHAVADVTNVSVFAINLVTALGLGLSVDYALLLLSRYREQIRAGDATEQAVITAVRTAGRTIAFSAITVLLALSAMLAFPPDFLKSFAYAGIAVVTVAVLAALLVLPALLVVLGPKVDAGRLRRPVGSRAPVGGSVDSTPSGSSPWGRLAAGVMRRPIAVIVPMLGLLVLLAIPLSSLRSGSPDDRVLPAAAAAHQVGDALRTNFDADASAAVDIVALDTDRSAAALLAQRISTVPGIATAQAADGIWRSGASSPAPGTGTQFSAGPNQRIIAALAVDPASPAAQTAVKRIRALSHPGASDVLVGGPTAVRIDDTATIVGHAGIAVLIIVVSTCVLLFLFTGSIVHPLRAILGNVITLSATLGLMVWIFQYGHFAHRLGFTAQPLNLSMLVLSACVAFGLSMDYEVFLLGRIKEARDHGASSAGAVVTGVAHTGGIITSCAALLAVSFFAFVTGGVSLIQLFGLATGVAILIDATVVRVVLIPATLQLLGDRAWYAPVILRRVHAAVGLADEAPRPQPPTKIPAGVSA